MGSRFSTNLLGDYNGQPGLHWPKAAVTILVSFVCVWFRGYASMWPSSGNWAIRENLLGRPKKDFYLGKQFIKYIGSLASTSSSVLVYHDMRSLELQSGRGRADADDRAQKARVWEHLGGSVGWARVCLTRNLPRLLVMWNDLMSSLFKPQFFCDLYTIPLLFLLII